jgi:hypothetical protein
MPPCRDVENDVSMAVVVDRWMWMPLAAQSFETFKSLVALCSRTSGQLYKPLLVNRNVCLHALPPWPECFDRKLHQLNQPDEHGHHP